jgi:hypothetical protein
MDFILPLNLLHGTKRSNRWIALLFKNCDAPFQSSQAYRLSCVYTYNLALEDSSGLALGKSACWSRGIRIPCCQFHGEKTLTTISPALAKRLIPRFLQAGCCGCAPLPTLLRRLWSLFRLTTSPGADNKPWFVLIPD